MPQMMPIYWFVICVLVNLFIYFFFSFYYYNFYMFSGSSFSKNKEGGSVSFLK